ncbi:hypothetical protein E4T39_00543 [Aureobasidium subglaciale]|nr:hypothetical protein E4T39_00543 [Aureobasidium subglaciale]
MAPVAKARRTGANVVRTSSQELDSYRPGTTSPYATHSPDDSIARSDVALYVDDRDERSQASLKRKRSTSLPYTPLLSPSMDNDSASDCGYLHLSPGYQDLPPMSLTIEVPTGHKGPLVSCADSGYSSTSSVTSEISKPNTTSKRSFLDLPAEIRNQIYRLAFVSEEKLDFAYPINFSRSSSLLQTCRQVHEEGRTILYSENTFYFQRRKKERAVRWTTDVYEIGYKDIRFFLKSIGLANVSLLRRLIVMFEDAQPSMNTHLKDADERRFTKDEDLIDILRMLGDHTMLKTLDLSFQGRRNFYNRDETRFIEYLTRIKADQVKCINNPDTPFSNWKGLSKIASADAGRLIHEMTRRVTIFR